jgi:hypothetical protein
MASLARLVIVGLIAGLSLAPSSGNAGTLTAATWLQTEQLFPAPGFPLTRTAADPRWSYSGTSTSTSIAANVNYFFTSTVFGVPKTPNVSLDLGVKVTQGGAQAITATGAGAAGSPGIGGTAILAIGLPLHVGMGVDQSMFQLGSGTLVAVPLNVGNAGAFTNTFRAGGVNHTITVNFYSWTVASVSFTGLTWDYYALPNVSAMGSFDLTANGGGMVTLVSPSLVSVDGAVSKRRTASITTLTLTFVPEPGTLLLLAGGAVALLLAARRGPR